jgi:hypothetical protein
VNLAMISSTEAMNLIYINSGNSSVMEGQVLSLLDFYKQTGKIKKITLLQGCKNSTERTTLKTKLKTYNLHVVWFKTWPNYTVFQYLAYRSLSKVLNNIDLDEQTIIHTRGEFYGAFVKQYLHKKKSGAKLLIDMRGLVAQEVKEYYNTNPLLKWNKIMLLKRTYGKIKTNTEITVISDAFKEHLVQNQGFDENNICVHPNIAGKQFTFNQEQRNKNRKQLNLNDDELVAICSSGGGEMWQKDYLAISHLVGLGIKVINLSSKNMEIQGVINKAVPFQDVPGYLAAADIAILWRDNNIINEIASPCKFSEFASMGLPVIHNKTVSLVTEFINSKGIGLIAESARDITEQNIRKFTSHNRNSAALTGRKIFGVEHIALSYLDTYQRIIGENNFLRKN